MHRLSINFVNDVYTIFAPLSAGFENRPHNLIIKFYKLPKTTRDIKFITPFLWPQHASTGPKFEPIYTVTWISFKIVKMFGKLEILAK